MKPEMILQSDMLDILFEGRNKEYGAYNLRRVYNSHLFKALGSMTMMVLLFVAFQFLQPGDKKDAAALFNVQDSVYITTVELPKDKQPEPEMPKPAGAQKVNTIKEVTPAIVPDDRVKEPLPTVQEVLDDKVAIGASTQPGDEASNGLAPKGTEGAVNGTGNGEHNAVEPAPEKEEVVLVAEKMPQYPGGVDALRRFLARNLQMPDGAVPEGQRIKIPTRFVVNKNGELTDVVFATEADEALKKEILRVMRKMPRWIPGSQNGRTVAVYFTIPIIFENSGEQ